MGTVCVECSRSASLRCGGCGVPLCSSECDSATAHTCAVAKAQKRVEAANAARSGGNSFFKAGKFAAARDAYKQSAELSPSAAGLSNLSAVHMKIGDYPAAAEAARRCISCDDKFAKGHVRLLTALLAQGDKEQGRIALQGLAGAIPDQEKLIAEWGAKLA